MVFFAEANNSSPNPATYNIPDSYAAGDKELLLPAAHKSQVDKEQSCK